MLIPQNWPTNTLQTLYRFHNLHNSYDPPLSVCTLWKQEYWQSSENPVFSFILFWEFLFVFAPMHALRAEQSLNDHELGLGKLYFKQKHVNAQTGLSNI